MGLTGPQGIQGASGATAAHHATHEPGGTDYLANSVWTNVANTFTAKQNISYAIPRLNLIDTGQPVDKRKFQLVAVNQQLHIQSLNDAETAGTGSMRMDWDGKVTITSLVAGGARIENATGAPTLVFKEASMAVDAKVWRIYGWQTNLVVDTVNDAETTILSTPLTINRSGAITVASTLTVAADIYVRTAWYPSLILSNSAMAVDAKNWWVRHDNGGACVIQAINDANTIIQSTPLQAHRNGTVTIQEGLTAKGLTATNAAGASLVLNDAPPNSQVNIQVASAYLRFHTYLGQISYMDMAGNWSMSGSVTAAGNLQTHRQLIAGMSGLVGGGAPSISSSATAVASLITQSTVHMDFGGYMGEDYAFWLQTKVNGQNAPYPLRINPLGGGVSIGSSLSVAAGLVVAGALQSGTVQTTGYVYPAPVTAPGTIQGSWYLGSHSSYGLYTNTGFYVSGGIWSAAYVSAPFFYFGTNHTALIGRWVGVPDNSNFPGTSGNGSTNTGWLQARDAVGAAIYIPYWK